METPLDLMNPLGNNMPVLFSGNQLVNAGNPTTITPRTINRANQINRRN